jgi:hypothetical protein
MRTKKKCSKCHIEKAVTEFGQTKHGGTRGDCNECKNAYARAQRQTPEGRALWKGYRETSRAKPETQVYEAAYGTEYRARPEVKEHTTIYNRAYAPKRKAHDEDYRIRTNYKTRIHKLLSHNLERYNDWLGCTGEEVIVHIEGQFSRGMSWDNRGLWEFDYIIPLVAFNLMRDEDRAVAFHWSNIQPLWHEDNQLKFSSLSLADIAKATAPSSKPISSNLRKRLIAYSRRHPERSAA